MQILHAHYIPDHPGLFFWAETSDVPAPTPARGRTAQNPKSKSHPFGTRPEFPGEKRTITLQLPAVRGIPLPSPHLVHNWEIGTEKPALAPFLVDGIFLPPEQALNVLLAFSTPQPDPRASYAPGPDFRYWNLVATLALETLAAQKLVPVMDGDTIPTRRHACQGA